VLCTKRLPPSQTKIKRGVSGDTYPDRKGDIMVDKIDKIDNDGDLLESLLKDQDLDPNEDPDKLPTGEDIKALNEQIETLNKEKHGLLQSAKSERRKRQEISGRLTQLTETVNGILTKRDAAADILEQQKPADPTAPKGIPVTITDDGDAFVDPENIQKMIEPYQSKINELEQNIQLTKQTATADQEAERVKNAIIGEDERFFTVNSKYQAARKWVLDQVVDFSRQNGINHELTSGQALDFVFNKELQSEFGEKFEDMTLVDVVTAEDSQHHFRQMLTNATKDVEGEPTTGVTKLDPKIDSRFQKVLDKPSGLGNQANAKAGVLSISEKMASLTTEEILGLTDAQAAAFEKALLEEEKSDGIKF